MRMATAQHVWREAAAAPFRREQVVRMILSDQHDRSATTTSRRGRRWRWPELQPHRPDVLAQERQRVLVGVCPSPGRLPARGPAVAIAAAAATEGAATVCTSPPRRPLAASRSATVGGTGCRAVPIAGRSEWRVTHPTMSHLLVPRREDGLYWDVLQLSKRGRRAMGRVEQAPSHATTPNSLLMN